MEDEENTLKKRFDKFDDEYIKFERIQNKFSSRPDIHAFILLNQLFPGDGDMVSAAEHDQIFLDVNVEEFNEKATDEQICDLVRCGLIYMSEYDCLGMWV